MYVSLWRGHSNKGKEIVIKKQQLLLQWRGDLLDIVLVFICIYILKTLSNLSI